jgi:DNA-binding NtrC family response regulator
MSSSTWTLAVLEGPDRGARFDIKDVVTRRVLIGTGPSCDVKLSDLSIAPRHAALDSDAHGARLVDLGSKGGTWMGGARIRDVYLPPISKITIGRTTLQLSTDSAPRILPTSTATRFGRIFGVSPEIRRLFPIFSRVAATNLAVLIEGEPGTGKRTLAESLHEASGRAERPFITLTAMSELEEAAGGTLFIQEVADLDLDVQTRLVRTLDRSDARVIASTRRNLDEAVAARRFRDDLYHHLLAARIELPPLRRRTGDVAFLTRLFWTRFGGDTSGLTHPLLERFASEAWPGNVRELSSAVARQCGGENAPADSFLERVVRSGEPYRNARKRVLDEFGRRYIEHVLALHEGNVTRAAAASGIGRRYFQMVRAKR